MNTFLHWTGIVCLTGAAWTGAAIVVACLIRRAKDNLKAQRYARARLQPPESFPPMTSLPPPARKLQAPPPPPPAPKLYPVRTTRPMRYGRCGCISMPCAAHLACGDMEAIARREMGDGR